MPNPVIGGCDWTRASTGHPAGIQVGMGDGSVHNVVQGTSYTTWWFAFTPNGGEPSTGNW